MLVITLLVPGSTPANVEWHINESMPEEVQNNLHYLNKVQADGDELEHIKSNFKNIPVCNHRRVVKWRGELARFIVEHL